MRKDAVIRRHISLRTIFVEEIADAGWLYYCHFSDTAHDWKSLKTYKLKC